MRKESGRKTQLIRRDEERESSKKSMPKPITVGICERQNLPKMPNPETNRAEAVRRNKERE